MESDKDPAKSPGVTPELNNEFLSSARVFAWSVREVIERTVLREVAGKNFTFSQLKLLYLVAHTDALNISDAATFLGVSPAAASKTVDKLVRRRLLRRAETQQDRRASHLSLTETSRRLMDAYITARDMRARAVFSQFSSEELRRTSEVLDRLAGAITSSGTDPNAVCMQCEIYFRDVCRFKEYGQRNCFYQHHQTEEQDRAGSSTEVVSTERGN
jgi:DNA-binding MarR family transcriptional regulator